MFLEPRLTEAVSETKYILAQFHTLHRIYARYKVRVLPPLAREDVVLMCLREFLVKDAERTDEQLSKAGHHKLSLMSRVRTINKSHRIAASRRRHGHSRRL